MLAARTGDRRALRDARASLAYATYFARSDGLVSCCGGPGLSSPYWFSDGYGDYLGAFNWAMGTLPELAPRGQSHLLSSTSVVQRISYARAGISYRTFGPSADVLRLSFRPARVLAGKRAAISLRPLPGADVVLRIRHDARTVSIVR
jgi:hypothetical protein